MKSTFNLIDKDEALNKLNQQIDIYLKSDFPPDTIYLVMSEETYNLFIQKHRDNPFSEVDFRDGEATYRNIRILNNDLLNIGEINIAVIM
jgi:hypothetical protein